MCRHPAPELTQCPLGRALVNITPRPLGRAPYENRSTSKGIVIVSVAG